MNPRRVAALAATAVLGLTGLTACGSSSDSESSSGSSSSSPSASSPSSASPSQSASSTKSAAAPAKIMIKDFKYSGATSVAAGAKVTVTNGDSEAHTVTTDEGGAFDVMVPPGKSVSFTAPAKAGAYAYHCTFHSNMKATLKVT